MHVETFGEMIQNFVDKVKDASGPNDVAFELFCNSGEIEYKFIRRSAEGLKRDGISMRNLAGDYIKERTNASADENAEEA